MRFIAMLSYATTATALLLAPAPVLLRTACSAGMGSRSATFLMAADSTLASVAIYDAQMEAALAERDEQLASLKAELETKSQEVLKFTDSVEGELKDAREKAKEAAKKLTDLGEELKESKETVAMLNMHIEAHIGATTRLNREVAELKEALAAAQAKATAE